jgi:hypothetical protein
MHIVRSLIFGAALISSLPSIAHAQIGSTNSGRPGISNPFRSPLGQPSPNAGSNSGTMGGTTFKPGASVSGMTTSQIRSTLQGKGFTNVQNLQRNGNTYTGIAIQNGQTVPVTIDANTGLVTRQ